MMHNVYVWLEAFLEMKNVYASMLDLLLVRTENWLEQQG